MRCQLVHFPTTNGAVSDLRDLADSIEKGEFGDAHNVAWVLDSGDSNISVGLAGWAGSPGAEALLLLACGQHKIVSNTSS